MENLNTALLLMVVGMATVFAILLIVINLGKSLIALVNKYAPEEVTPAKPGEMVPPLAPVIFLQALVAAVPVWPQGKGKVVREEKFGIKILF